MKALFDTNTLIAALVETHPHHSRALPWLQKAKQKDITALMGAHSLAEVYSTLTKLPIYPKISPVLAEKLILEDLIPHFQIIELDQNDYRTVLHITLELQKFRQNDDQNHPLSKQKDGEAAKTGLVILQSLSQIALLIVANRIYRNNGLQLERMLQLQGQIRLCFVILV
jgi:predicted nucleic acid-binding protein